MSPSRSLRALAVHIDLGFTKFSLFSVNLRSEALDSTLRALRHDHGWAAFAFGGARWQTLGTREAEC